MSRGFVREGDQEPTPIIPERAPLPDGIPNYVTAEGLRLLQEELDGYEEEKAELLKEGKLEQHRVDVRVLDIKMSMVEERIRTAQEVEVDKRESAARFGMLVGYRLGSNGPINRFRIVGVDEADVKQGKIAFTSPIAKALIGMKAGEIKDWQLGVETRRLELVEVE